MCFHFYLNDIINLGKYPITEIDEFSQALFILNHVKHLSMR